MKVNLNLVRSSLLYIHHIQVSSVQLTVTCFIDYPRHCVVYFSRLYIHKFQLETMSAADTEYSYQTEVNFLMFLVTEKLCIHLTSHVNATFYHSNYWYFIPNRIHWSIVKAAWTMAQWRSGQHQSDTVSMSCIFVRQFCCIKFTFFVYNTGGGWEDPWRMPIGWPHLTPLYFSASVRRMVSFP